MTHPAEGKLLPCPFCGAQPTTDRAGTPGKFGPIPTVRCTNEECFGPHTTAQFLADAVKQWNTRRSQGGKAHKVMTPEEYAATKIQGWHSICRDYDGAGNVAIQYGAYSPAESDVKPTDANISVLAEAVYHCGCPAGGMTVGECAEQGVCGCSIRAERIKGCMGPDHQYFSREESQP